jgi:hypothetical protein
MICKKCHTERILSNEDRYYYEKGGLIINGELIRCPNCISETISFTTEPYSRVLPVPSFGLDAMFSPRQADIFVEINPVKHKKRSEEKGDQS